VSALYTLFRNEIMSAGLEGESVSSLMSTADVRAILTDSSYSPATSDQYLSEIDAGWRVGSAVSLSGVSVSGGVFDATDITFSSVSGNNVYTIVLYLHTGTESTSHLIGYIDAFVGRPIVPNGGDITISWSSAAAKIFSIG